MKDKKEKISNIENNEVSLDNIAEINDKYHALIKEWNKSARINNEQMFKKNLQDSGLAVIFKKFDEFLQKVDPKNESGSFINAEKYLKQVVGIFSAEDINKKDETPFVLPNNLEINKQNYFDAFLEVNWQVLKVNQRAKVVNWFCEDNNINLLLFPQDKQMIFNQKTYLNNSKTLFFGLSELFNKNTPINYLSKILRIKEREESSLFNNKIELKSFYIEKEKEITDFVLGNLPLAKKIFEENGFEPMDLYTANELLKNRILKVGQTESFTGKWDEYESLKSKNIVEKNITISKNNWQNAFFHPIWSNMDINQRAQVTQWCFDSICKERNLQNFKLDFLPNSDNSDNTYCLGALENEKTVFLNFDSVLNNNFSYQALLTLSHELWHAKREQYKNSLPNNFNTPLTIRDRIIKLDPYFNSNGDAVHFALYITQEEEKETNLVALSTIRDVCKINDKTFGKSKNIAKFYREIFDEEYYDIKTSQKILNNLTPEIEKIAALNKMYDTFMDSVEDIMKQTGLNFIPATEKYVKSHQDRIHSIEMPLTKQTKYIRIEIESLLQNGKDSIGSELQNAALEFAKYYYDLLDKKNNVENTLNYVYTNKCLPPDLTEKFYEPLNTFTEEVKKAKNKFKQRTNKEYSFELSTEKHNVQLDAYLDDVIKLVKKQNEKHFKELVNAKIKKMHQNPNIKYVCIKNGTFDNLPVLAPVKNNSKQKNSNEENLTH